MSGNADDAIKAAWTLSYDSFDPSVEGRREALFTVGNGYFATRGAAADARDHRSDRHAA